ncbi:MAG: hypothetical protein AAGE84_15795 [Cyanobacteria bacterium P01_G01_bin.39]
MMTIASCQNDLKPALNEPDQGKQHLLSALDSGQQVFLEALHDVMDAILEELTSD